MSMPKITGIATIRNGLEAGYPFLEAFMSIYPAVDLYLINDGGSNDGTLELLKRLEDVYPKVEIHQIPDRPSMWWETIDHVLNYFIDIAPKGWLWEAQGDEFWHERDLPALCSLVADLDEKGFNSIRQRRIEVSSWSTPLKYSYHTIRILRKVEGLRSYEGGDSFHLGESRRARDGFTTHNVPPEYDSEIPFYHLVCPFPAQYLKKAERHAFFLARGSRTRREVYERVKSRGSRVVYEERAHWLPALARAILVSEIYKPRKEIFDPEWMRELTGLEH